MRVDKSTGVLGFLLCIGVLCAARGSARVVSAQASPAAGCIGDCAGNGIVTVDDLITGAGIILGSVPPGQCLAFGGPGGGAATIATLVTGVNNALHGCVSSCPYDLASNIPDTAALCDYVGRWNMQCGDSSLGGTFFGDGMHLLVGLATDPIVFFGGTVVSPTQVSLEVWFTDPNTDPNSQDIPISGEISLSADHDVLQVVPSGEPPFTLDMCDFVAYQGMYVGQISPSAGVASKGREVATMFRALHPRP